MRNSSIETLRIVSIFLIIMMHVSALVDYNTASTVNKIWLGVINSIGNSGVTCFILISGYYGVRFNKKKWWYLVVVTTIYSVVVSLLNNGQDTKSTLKAILCLPLYRQWFVVCYLALMLLSPYINKLAEVFAKNDFKKLLFILVVLFSVIPTIFYSPSINGVFLHEGGKCLTYFIFIYLIGRFIRLHKDDNLREKNRIPMAIGGVTFFFLFTLALVLAASYITHQRFFIYCYDSSITILCQSILIFYIAKSYSFHSPFVNLVSSSVFAIYVLNESYKYIDWYVFHVKELGCASNYILALIGETLLVFVVAFMIDQTFGRLVRCCFRFDK